MVIGKVTYLQEVQGQGTSSGTKLRVSCPHACHIYSPMKNGEFEGAGKKFGDNKVPIWCKDPSALLPPTLYFKPSGMLAWSREQEISFKHIFLSMQIGSLLEWSFSNESISIQ
jgi:hypothetical protein